MNQALPKRAQFHHMKDGTQEDWEIIGAEFFEFRGDVCKRIKDHLMLLDGDCGGFPVDRLTHCLQTATLAHQDGKDEEYVVCALLHDIGDNLAPSNHADFAATLLEPFVSDKNYWIVKHHGIFQGYYFFEYLGLDKNMRDKFQESPHYEDCKEFCEKYDQNSFDPNYECLPLEFFMPMVKKVFASPKKSIYKNSN